MDRSAVLKRYSQHEEPAWQKALKVGAVGGVMAMLVCLIGMVESFSKRDIIDQVMTSGQVLLVILALVTGYFAARRTQAPGLSAVVVSLHGALAGTVLGTMLALLALLIERTEDVRDVLANASPALLEILTFNQPLAVGAALLVGVGALLGLVGGALFLTPATARSALLTGLSTMLVIGLLQELVQLVLKPRVPTIAAFFFGRDGLTVAGGLLLFLLPALGQWLGITYGETLRARVALLPEPTRRALRWALLGLGGLFLLVFPRIFGRFPTEVMNNVALLGVLMGLGLNIVVGFAGLLDLGYVGFFAIGAYTMAILTSPEVGFANLTFWQALPFAILVSVTMGVILGIPVLKMRGDYLAIVTLGFGEIIRILFLSDALKPYTGGAQGIIRIPNATVGAQPLNTPETLYYLLLASVLLTWFISGRLRDSRLGRAWMAIREDEDVAEAMGIDLVATKLLAFGTGASMAGFGGAIFASKLQSIVPQSFDLLISVNALAIIIIGGLASIPGVVVGALLLIGLPELLREFAEYRLWVYGILLVVMMIYRPEGFVPEPTRRRELHTEEVPEAATVATESVVAP